MDFVADQLFTGEKLRALTILDIFTRQSTEIGIGLCYKSLDVVESLERAIQVYMESLKLYAWIMAQNSLLRPLICGPIAVV